MSEYNAYLALSLFLSIFRINAYHTSIHCQVNKSVTVSSTSHWNVEISVQHFWNIIRDLLPYLNKLLACQRVEADSGYEVALI